MASRVVWKIGDLVSIKLRDNLFTIAQMLRSPALRFYDISNETGVWKDVDLNQIKPLFRVFVGRVVNKHLIHEKIKDKTVIASQLPYEPYWIDTYTSYIDGEHYKGGSDGFTFFGGRLIDIGDGSICTTKAPVIKHDLAIPEDREIIEQYELTNMWGEKDLSDRLIRYFDTGINRDDLKFEVFPALWNDREKLRPLTRRLPVPLR